MSKTLRVLHVEDSERNAEPLRRHLTRLGYQLIADRVETPEAMRAALETQEWDVILCDYSMTHFNALSALALLRETRLDIPFIIISGTIGEDAAVAPMIAGASDYSMKDNPARLAPIIERELHEPDNRHARLNAEEVLRESEDRYRDLVEHSHDLICTHDLDGQILSINKTAARALGYEPEELLGRNVRDALLPELHDEFGDYIKAIAKEGVARGMMTVRTRTGERRVWEYTNTLRTEGVSIPVVRGLSRDVTEQKQTEAALKHAEAKYRTIFENAVEGIFQSTPDGKFISANPAMVRILGYESQEDLIKHRTNIGARHYVDPNCQEELERMLAEHGVVSGFECEVFRKDMSRIWVSENVRAVRDESGAVIYYEGSFEDITERKKLEAQFQQSQKLEAVGQLAGGIAHDFNNLLTAITGYAELAQRRISADEPLYRNLAEIKKAAERAASLTGQLLAFSRKQILQPKVINLNAIVSEMDRMLRRLIGEDISLLTKTEPGLGSVKADPGQIGQVIMNLVVNARDAMPEGGSLTIETANVFLGDEYSGRHVAVTPGPYVLLAVSDTGKGMDAEIRERIFEPFFTTKEVGKGTGLGLSTVYGIVKQSGGNVWVYSEVGHGTTFKIYLPRIDEWEGDGGRDAQRAEEARSDETILLVEDDDSVRNLAREVLEMGGYKVLEVSNGGAAFLTCKQHEGRINLMLTDVVMPEMSGQQLSERLEKVRPEMRVLFMSGYTDSAIVHHGMLDEDTNFIQKPFSPDGLLRKVRQVLDS